MFGKKKSAASIPDTNSIAPSTTGGDIGNLSGGKSFTLKIIKKKSNVVLYNILIKAGEGSQHTNNAHLPEPVRIIHKEQESISAFCLNLLNPGLLALATPRECQEMDISLLLESPNWLEDECELDIMNLNKDIDKEPASNFLMIQASSDK